MGIFGDKDSIVGAALGVGGAFDKNRKTDSATVFGAALGASIGSGKKWTMEDSIKLGTANNASKRRKNVSISNVAGARTYSIETEQDIDKFLSEMKQKLMNELEEDTIITLS